MTLWAVLGSLCYSIHTISAKSYLLSVAGRYGSAMGFEELIKPRKSIVYVAEEEEIWRKAEVMQKKDFCRRSIYLKLQKLIGSFSGI